MVTATLQNGYNYSSKWLYYNKFSKLLQLLYGMVTISRMWLQLLQNGNNYSSKWLQLLYKMVTISELLLHGYSYSPKW